MASIRAIFLVTSDNKLLFSRKFLTVENRLKRNLGNDYTPWPKDNIIINAFYNQIVKEELLQEEFKCKTYIEDLEIDHQKMEELIDKVDININVKNFQNYSECPIVTLDIGSTKIWPCIYIKKYKLYGIVFPNIDIDRYKNIKLNLENENKAKKLNLTPDTFNFKLKKLYEEQDLSILGSFILIENLLNYVISNNNFEENQLHTLISNMVPFGNIIENNINFMLKSLNYLSSKLTPSNYYQNDKKSLPEQDKIKIPGWVTVIPNNSKETLKITIKEELKFVKFGQEKNFNTILCDISCLSQLSTNCEITLPIKENSTNYLGNLRIHPCAKIEKQDVLNDSTRIIFIPPIEEFKMGVFEIENVEQKRLPIIAEFSLKESSQNEVKLFLNVQLDESAINKFEYFYINIPLGHFGVISGTKIMVQVGEVSLVNNKTTLHWNLQNKVFDSNIVLSGTVNYYPKASDSVSNKEDKKESEKVKRY